MKDKDGRTVVLLPEHFFAPGLQIWWQADSDGDYYDNDDDDNDDTDDGNDDDDIVMRTVSAGLLSFLSSLCAHLLLIS